MLHDWERYVGTNRPLHPSGHDLVQLRNDENFSLVSAGVDASGIPDQSRSGCLVEADRIAGGGVAAPRPRPRASASSPPAKSCLGELRPQPLAAAKRPSRKPLAPPRR